MSGADCERPVLARGMCTYHYNRWRRPAPVIPDEKACSRCGHVKPSSDYHRSKKGLRSWCRACVQEDNRRRMRIRRYGTDDLGLAPLECLGCGVTFTPWRRDQMCCSKKACGRWVADIARKYGISAADYRAMFESQCGRCATCDVEHAGKRFAVDHDHSAGAIRALLCQRCNLVLGQVEDDAKLLRSMVKYLQSHAS